MKIAIHHLRRGQEMEAVADLLRLDQPVAHQGLPRALPLDGEQLAGVHDVVELQVLVGRDYCRRLRIERPLGVEEADDQGPLEQERAFAREHKQKLLPHPRHESHLQNSRQE